MTTPKLLLTLSALLATAGAAQAQMAFDPGAAFGTGAQPSGLAAADFDGDGLLDLATTAEAPDRLEVYRGNGAGGFSLFRSVPLGGGSSPSAVAAFDADGDGDMDVAVALKGGPPDAVQLVLNAGGAFVLSGGQTSVGGTRPSYLAAGDLDGDGTPDLVTSNRDSDTFSFLRGTGTGFVLLGTLATQAEPRHVILADLDGDGDKDVAVACHDSRTLNWFPNLFGTGLSFGAAQVLSVGGQVRPDGVTAGDFDGDGDLDLAAAVSGNGLNLAAVFTNDSTGVFSGPRNWAVGGLNPAGIVSADFDRDGLADLACANQDSGNVSALESLGVVAGIGADFGAALVLGAGTTPEDIVAADFDCDGAPDLAVANRDSNNVTVFMNQNAGGAVSYCTAGTTTSGCNATLSGSGTPSLSNAGAFTLSAAGVEGGKQGLFFYGISGRTAVPWGAGTSFRCVRGPTQRTPVQNSGGTGGACNGSFTLDWNGYVAANPSKAINQALTVGATVDAQAWFRDPPAPRTTNLSDAVEFVVCP